MSFLSEREEEVCIYTGIFGGLLTFATTIQHFMLYNILMHWIPATIMAIYLFTLASFIMLARQKSYAPLMLLISAAGGLLAAVMTMAGPVFSLLALLQFIVTTTLVIVMYMDGLPARLRGKALALAAEESLWRDKI